MEFHTLLLYLTFVIVATASPGPAVLFAIYNSISHGLKKTTYAILGNITGLFVLGIIAISGLSTLLQTSVVAFTVVKYLGALYLIYLGLKLLLKKESPLHKPDDDFKETNSINLFIKAFLIAVTNPKAIVFLTALFPQFIVLDQPLVPQFLFLIIILMFFSFFFLILYALMAHKSKKWLNHSSHIKLINRITGSIFIGFGILLFRSSNR